MAMEKNDSNKSNKIKLTRQILKNLPPDSMSSASSSIFISNCVVCSLPIGRKHFGKCCKCEAEVHRVCVTFTGEWASFKARFTCNNCSTLPSSVAPATLALPKRVIRPRVVYTPSDYISKRQRCNPVPILPVNSSIEQLTVDHSFDALLPSVALPPIIPVNNSIEQLTVDHSFDALLPSVAPSPRFIPPLLLASSRLSTPNLATQPRNLPLGSPIAIDLPFQTELISPEEGLLSPILPPTAEFDQPGMEFMNSYPLNESVNPAQTVDLPPEIAPIDTLPFNPPAINESTLQQPRQPEPTEPVYSIIEGGTKRQKLLLSDGLGYNYSVNYEGKKIRRWRCTHRTSVNPCRGELLFNFLTESYSIRKEHNHPGKFGIGTVAEIYRDARNDALREIFKDPRDIINDNLRNKENIPGSHLPSVHNMRCMINRARAKARPAAPGKAPGVAPVEL